MNITLLTEYLTEIGGAERVFADLVDLYPKAELRAIISIAKKVPWLRNNYVRESEFGRNLPNFIKKRYQYFLPFLPVGVERMAFDDTKLIISVSHSFAKGILVPQRSFHVCYCTSPTRYLWDWTHRYIQEKKVNFLIKPIVHQVFHKLRVWDYAAAQRVDRFIAISKTVQKRIKHFYNRESKVIYPGVDFNRFKIQDSGAKNGKYWLIVSRLSAYKNIKTAVEVFNKMQLPLIIVGKGEQRLSLKRLAGENIKFLDNVSEDKLKRLYKNAYAYIVPGVEDFGLAAVEAMACGKPVLAFRKGGLTEIIKEGINGEFFDNDSYVPVMADGVRRLRENYKNYDPRLIRKSVEKFGIERFKREFKEYVSSLVS